MDDIVALLQEAKFLETWKQYFNRDLRMFETINLNGLVRLHEEVTLLITYQYIILKALELGNFDPTSQKIQADCSLKTLFKREM